MIDFSVGFAFTCENMRQSANRSLQPESRRVRGFTIIELLIVITIIAVLASLVLGVAGYVNRKGATSRVEAEMKAMEAACESYKSDNGIYPRDTATTDVLNAQTDCDPATATYMGASLSLYKELSGAKTSPYRVKDANATQYMAFNPRMLSPSAGTVTNIRDPFGYSYGYSTINQANNEKTPPANPAPGYNPTFDLWSTAGGQAVADQPKWIKNW
jgi:prepilin-type N-terminal cleavage/methylation domain-containing protein